MKIIKYDKLNEEILNEELYQELSRLIKTWMKISQPDSFKKDVFSNSTSNRKHFRKEYEQLDKIVAKGTYVIHHKDSNHNNNKYSNLIAIPVNIHNSIDDIIIKKLGNTISNYNSIKDACNEITDLEKAIYYLKKLNAHSISITIDNNTISINDFMNHNDISNWISTIISEDVKTDIIDAFQDISEQVFDEIINDNNKGYDVYQYDGSNWIKI